LLNFKFNNQNEQTNKITDRRTRDEPSDYENETKYNNTKWRGKQIMSKNDRLLIMLPDGTQVRIGQDSHSVDSICNEQFTQISPKADRGRAPDECVSTALSNRQLVIMSEALLDVSLSSQFTNIKALARFISKVSGRSEGSIRTCINNGIDYDNAHVRNDVESVAILLEPIKPELADVLRKNIE
jgi:hypothetical protein